MDEGGCFDIFLKGLLDHYLFLFWTSYSSYAYPKVVWGGRIALAQGVTCLISRLWANEVHKRTLPWLYSRLFSSIMGFVLILCTLDHESTT